MVSLAHHDLKRFQQPCAVAECLQTAITQCFTAICSRARKLLSIAFIKRLKHPLASSRGVLDEISFFFSFESVFMVLLWCYSFLHFWSFQ